MSTPMPDAAVVFPGLPGSTSVVLEPVSGSMPSSVWLGAWADGSTAAQIAACRGSAVGPAVLVEAARGQYGRPGLRGHRLGDGSGPSGSSGCSVAGRDWSTAFAPTGWQRNERTLILDAEDRGAGLTLRTEIESLVGGALRMRHTVTNAGAAPYVVDALEVCLPLGDQAHEALDFTGRHEHERSPQRRAVTDGLWLRENRHGRTGLDSATLLVVGPTGFGFSDVDVVGVHVAWSGNSVLWVEREPGTHPVVGAGELLLPGEVVLAEGEAYSTPWVVVAAAIGLDGVADSLHRWQRSLPAHPHLQPVVLNVWEAVYFDHELTRLLELADLAASIGVERFVLDDGWFAGRRDDTAGLGDWWVDEDVWPKGLHPLIDHVRGLGMQFGLWFEPEMVNPDSDLFREHPDWILATGGRTPPLSRNQLVLDLTRSEVFAHVLDRLDRLLTEYEIDYVKWDHNRDLPEAGTSPSGTPAAHRQALAHYALLDELRARHPHVAFESCAAGGGRIDLGILERVQRVWPSDMTDALARQSIQPWTGQLLAPEYLGAHISATVSHQTGRVLPLAFRAATALFGAFGIEWDLTEADAAELAELGEWVRRHQRLRLLLHSGRTVRQESGDPAVRLHGVVAADGLEALFAHVQLDESISGRGVVLRMPGLEPSASYDLRWAAPVDEHRMSQSPPLPAGGPTAGVTVTGRVLADIGICLPRRRPDTILLIHVTAVGANDIGSSRPDAMS